MVKNINNDAFENLFGVDQKHFTPKECLLISWKLWTNHMATDPWDRCPGIGLRSVQKSPFQGKEL